MNQSEKSLISEILNAQENEHLEVKEAKTGLDFKLLVKYCSALANEKGGRLVLGVTDKLPRTIVGTQGFQNLAKIKADLVDQVRLRIEIDEIIHPEGRVLIFNVPSRPLGLPIQYKGAYWMRRGEGLVAMTPDMLQKIFQETEPDFSAEPSPDSRLDDLSTVAIEHFRDRWQRKSKNKRLLDLSIEQLLEDAELISTDGITRAALILFGKREALRKRLPQAELIFEYRAKEVSGPAQHRVEFQEGWFLFDQKLLETVNLRNDTQHFQDGLFVWDIPTFNEKVLRESILNAICHRDYRMQNSVFIRQFPRKLEVDSPGGFPPGVTAENILWRQAPRNRRIAETLQRCGVVERSGQGMNLIFEESIRESKTLPDFKGTDSHHVTLTLHGEVNDPQFLRFLEKVGNETLSSFSTEDLLVLDLLHRDKKIPQNYKERLAKLLATGVIERAGRGKYILSRSFYKFIKRKGEYTRKKGLDRETNKALLLRHIQENNFEGSPLRELIQVLPNLTRFQVQRLLRELKEEEKVQVRGSTRAGRWYPKIN